MTDLRIAEGLSLPLDTATDTLGLLAVKGAGKTYTFLVLAEEMIKAGLPVVIVDPVGVCWGLRASADGEGAGLPVVILGGSHGDVPLASTSGAAVADMLAAERVACVLDLSAFDTKAEAIRFVLDFITRLYQVNREPLHVILDEADDVAPQKPFGEETRMLRAVEVMVRRGRARGLGVTLATQRAAVLNKNVLTQISTLIVGRTVAPTDRKAIEAWVEAHGTTEQRDELLGSLASLPTGTVWVWSPMRGIFQKVRIRARETFDSSATPKVGQIVAAPKVLASVDLDAIRAQLAAATEPSSPKATRDQKRADGEQARLIAEQQQRITVLEAELRQLRERPAFDVAVLERAEHAIIAAESAAMRTIDAVGELKAEIARHRTTSTPVTVESSARPSPPAETRPRGRSESRTRVVTPTDLSNPQVRILEALASFQALGLDSVAKSNVAVFSGASPKSSGFANNLGALRTKGLISYPSGGTVAITDDGLACVDEPRPIRSLDELHEAWYAKLPRPQAAILRVLIRAFPGSCDRDELAAQVGQSPTSSGYANNLGALRSLGLLNYLPGRRAIANRFLLFPEGMQ